MPKKKAAAIGKRLGLDPAWHKNDLTWTILAIQAPCKLVADAYRRAAKDTQGLPIDCLAKEIKISGADWARAIFVYQLKSSRWTHIQPLADSVIQGNAEKLAKKSKTKVLEYSYEDTAGVFGYTYFENGKCVEEFISAELFGEDRDDMIANGWQINDRDTLQLWSKRRGKLDMNSPEIRDLPDRIARELKLYIPFEPWTIDSDTGKVMLNKPWTRKDMLDAQLLLSKH
jgi:hypothetical protein